MKTEYKLPDGFINFVIIHWLDAYVTADEIETMPELTVSFGVKVKEDNEYVYLSHFYDGISKSFDSPFTAIPKGMIKKIHTMKDFK